MHNISFQTGTILLGENNHPKKGNHYIVFLEKLTNTDFIGGMISTSSYFGNNFPMLEEAYKTIKEATVNCHKPRILFAPF